MLTFRNFYRQKKRFELIKENIHYEYMLNESFSGKLKSLVASVLIGTSTLSSGADTNSLPQTRGIRNNNPGNIRSNVKWQGMSGSDGQFAKFKTSEFGIRALGRLIRTYYIKHKLQTVQAIIHRWAPSNENKTEQYADFVATKMGVSINQQLDLFDKAGNIRNQEQLANLVTAIIQFENGSKAVYPTNTINNSLQTINQKIKK